MSARIASATPENIEKALQGNDLKLLLEVYTDACCGSRPIDSRVVRKLVQKISGLIAGRLRSLTEQGDTDGLQKMVERVEANELVHAACMRQPDFIKAKAMVEGEHPPIWRRPSPATSVTSGAAGGHPRSARPGDYGPVAHALGFPPHEASFSARSTHVSDHASDVGGGGLGSPRGRSPPSSPRSARQHAHPGGGPHSASVPVRGAPRRESNSQVLLAAHRDLEGQLREVTTTRVALQQLELDAEDRSRELEDELSSIATERLNFRHEMATFEIRMETNEAVGDKVWKKAMRAEAEVAEEKFEAGLRVKAMEEAQEELKERLRRAAQVGEQVRQELAQTESKLRASRAAGEDLSERLLEAEAQIADARAQNNTNLQRMLAAQADLEQDLRGIISSRDAVRQELHDTESELHAVTVIGEHVNRHAEQLEADLLRERFRQHHQQTNLHAKDGDLSDSEHKHKPKEVPVDTGQALQGRFAKAVAEVAVAARQKRRVSPGLLEATATLRRQLLEAEGHARARQAVREDQLEHEVGEARAATRVCRRELHQARLELRAREDEQAEMTQRAARAEAAMAEDIKEMKAQLQSRELRLDTTRSQLLRTEVASKTEQASHEALSERALRSVARTEAELASERLSWRAMHLDLERQLREAQQQLRILEKTYAEEDAKGLEEQLRKANAIGMAVRQELVEAQSTEAALRLEMSQAQQARRTARLSALSVDEVSRLKDELAEAHRQALHGSTAVVEASRLREELRKVELHHSAAGSHEEVHRLQEELHEAAKVRSELHRELQEALGAGGAAHTGHDKGHRADRGRHEEHHAHEAEPEPAAAAAEPSELSTARVLAEVLWERRDLHDEQYAKVYGDQQPYDHKHVSLQDSLVLSMTRHVLPVASPWAVFLAGPPGAGKGHIVRWLALDDREVLPGGYAHLDVEAVRHQLPAWAEDPEKSEATVLATQVEAGYVNELAAVHCAMGGRCFIFDATFRNPRWYRAFMDQLRRCSAEHFYDAHMQKAGHEPGAQAVSAVKVCLIYVDADLQDCERRAAERTLRLSAAFVRECHEQVREAVEALKEDVDLFVHLRNVEGEEPAFEADGATQEELQEFILCEPLAGAEASAKQEKAPEEDGAAADADAAAAALAGPRPPGARDPSRASKKDGGKDKPAGKTGSSKDKERNPNPAGPPPPSPASPRGKASVVSTGQGAPSPSKGPAAAQQRPGSSSRGGPQQPAGAGAASPAAAGREGSRDRKGTVGSAKASVASTGDPQGEAMGPTASQRTAKEAPAGRKSAADKEPKPKSAASSASGKAPATPKRAATGLGHEGAAASSQGRSGRGEKSGSMAAPSERDRSASAAPPPQSARSAASTASRSSADAGAAVEAEASVAPRPEPKKSPAGGAAKAKAGGGRATTKR